MVNYFGPTDLGAKDIPEVSKRLVKDFLGASAEEKPELAAKASPRTYVSKDDAPILTFQGTKDPLVPFTQAIELAEAMTAARRAGPGRAARRGPARLGRCRDGAHPRSVVSLLRPVSQTDRPASHDRRRERGDPECRRITSRRDGTRSVRRPGGRRAGCGASARRFPGRRGTGSPGGNRH